MTSLRWNYTAWLLAVYVAVFESWLVLPRAGILWSGAIATVMLALLELHMQSRGYFLNRWDRFTHTMVVLDIALEAFVIPLHEHRGFYLCALAFALVIAAYRWALVRGGRLAHG